MNFSCRNPLKKCWKTANSTNHHTVTTRIQVYKLLAVCDCKNSMNDRVTIDWESQEWQWSFVRKNATQVSWSTVFQCVWNTHTQPYKCQWSEIYVNLPRYRNQLIKFYEAKAMCTDTNTKLFSVMFIS